MQDKESIEKQQRVAAKCKLKYMILFDNEVGLRGYQKLFPQAAGNMYSP